MRRVRALLALAALLLAGCASDPAPATDACPKEADCVATPPPACTGPLDDCVMPDGRVAVDAPSLPVGRAWTYRDAYVYDAEERITIVVATAGPQGYLFAGASEADVVSAAVWGRPWFGPQDRSLHQEGYPRILDFPLVDGKTWETREGVTVTARETDVTSVAGTERGFVISGSTDDFDILIEYQPSVGYFTRWLTLVDGEPFVDLELESVATASSFVHWEEVARSRAAADGDEQPATAFVVPDEHDAVLFSVGGRDGGRTLVTPPLGAGEPWTEEFAGPEAWRARAYAANAGPWTLAAAHGDGFGWIEAAAVKWVRGTTS